MNNSRRLQSGELWTELYLRQLNKNCVLCFVPKSWQQREALQRLKKRFYRISEWTEQSHSKANMTHQVLPQGTCTGYMFYLLVWVSCVWQLQTCPVPAELWGCVHLFTDAVQCFFPSKLCMSLSIPSKVLDAKSPQGMCQRLLNTLCTLSLILHGCGFTVGKMQMAAHGIPLWGNKGNCIF